jgi:hypothetical protein
VFVTPGIVALRLVTVITVRPGQLALQPIEIGLR